jgi:hypothetical protein
MQPTETHLAKTRRLMVSGLSQQTLRTTATAIWGLSLDEVDQIEKKTKKGFALEATCLDTLGELMLTYRKQEQLYDEMTRQHKREDLPASFFNTQRLLLSDMRATCVSLDTTRTKAGRDCSKPPEKARERRRRRRESAAITFRHTESNRQQGYFYDNRHGIVQPGNNILSWEVAVRDIIRMRMLPKSQYEDYMIAQMLDALTEEEKKLNPETLSKEEVNTDLHRWDAEFHCEPGPTKYQEESLLAQRIFLERIQEYNKTWADAEKHVDGLLAARGMKLGMRFPYVGVPPVVKKAAEGDPAAIAEIKEAIKPDTQGEADWGRPWSIDYSKSTFLPDPSGYNYGKALSYIVTMLLAFTCSWTCLCLVVGPHALACLDSSHHAPRDEAETRQQLDNPRIDITPTADDTPHTPHDVATSHRQHQNLSATSNPRLLTRSVRSTITAHSPGSDWRT